MKRLLTFLFCCIVSVSVLANDTPEMVKAAQTFLNSLNDEQKAKAELGWDHEERMNWHFIPKVRAGLPLKEMKIHQQQLALALFSSGMSSIGLQKAYQIMMLEQILHELEDNAPHRDSSLYYVSIYGQPSEEGTWGWRLEGHHASYNFTLDGGKVISSTPLFMGANPHKVLQGAHKGLRVLGAEEDLARQLVTSLHEEQRKTAVIAAEAPKDIFTSAERRVNPLSPTGLSVSEMNEDQAKILFEIIREYIYRVRPVYAERDIREIEAAPEKISFAWMGGLNAGEGHYYRIQGPTFLLEYDNVQNGNNHSHTVWRDFNGDFGEDILKKHHEENHQ